MRRNPLKGIRWKLVLLCFFSTLLTLCTLYVFRQVGRDLINVYALTRIPLVDVFVHLSIKLNYMIGFPVVPSIAGICLFIVFVSLLSHNTVTYLGTITGVVKQVASGNLNQRLPVKADDELGELADNVNRMAQQLKTSMDEERRAVQAKNELITNVSHDLRTPLTSILGYLRLIDDDRYKDEVELRHYVHIVHQKSQRLARMVNDLFEYTKMSAAESPLQRTELNLVELLGQVSADFSPQLVDAGMELKFHVEDEKILVYADGDKLMRVFENLIGNAIRYGKQGKTVQLAVFRSAQVAVVRVVNHGQPIPQLDLPHVFERFYRVEKSRSDETGGAGLGLAIVKSIVDLHAGEVSVTSDYTETAFEVRLPRIS